MSTASVNVSARGAIEAIVGSEHVVPPGPALAAAVGSEPSMCVSPASDEEIAAILRTASELQLPVVPVGGLTHQHYSPAEDGVIALDLRRLKRVLHYDAGDLTLGVAAGTTLSETNALTAPNRQLLPIQVATPLYATIGGALAVAAEGPLRHGYGAIRDFCIGIHFVTADGNCAKGGGRVVKNVAGYDMMKLLIGSYGTLGVITAASFKLFPLPQRTCTFVCNCDGLDQAIVLRDQVAASALAPISLDLISPRAQEFLQPYSEARDPDHLAPEQIRGGPAPRWCLALRAAGSDSVLARYQRELGAAATRVEGSAEQELWSYIVGFEAAMAGRHRNVMSLRVAVPATDVASMLRHAERAALDYNFVSASLGRAGLGSFVVGFIPLSIDPPPANHYASAGSAFRSLLPRGSLCSVLRCPQEARQHFSTWGEPTTDLALMQQIKRTLDPRSILNRGRYLV